MRGEIKVCKTTYTCDHCGKEITLNERGCFENGYSDVCIDFNNAFCSTEYVDLCKDCVNELFDIVENFISKAVE